MKTASFSPFLTHVTSLRAFFQIGISQHRFWRGGGELSLSRDFSGRLFCLQISYGVRPSMRRQTQIKAARRGRSKQCFSI